jgi:transposase
MPPYSPNLNLMGHTWEHLKSRVRSKYYNQFDVFKKLIDSIIDDADKSSKALVNRFIGESVQIFDSLVSVNDNSFVVSNASGEETDLAA